MGNSMRMKGKKAVKVMKIDGTTIRLKPPVIAAEVLRPHPGHSLLDSDEVRRIGVRARPLDPFEALAAGRVYFLVELPRLPDQRAPRRALSGALNVGAKDRLEGLLLTRRAVSDISIPAAEAAAAARRAREGCSAEDLGEGAVRMRMRLPRAQVSKLVEESRDAAEAAQKILDLCVAAAAACAPPPPSPPPLAPAAGGNMRRHKDKTLRFAVFPREVSA